MSDSADHWLNKQVQEDLEMQSYICSTAKQTNFKHSFDNMFGTFHNLHPFDIIKIWKTRVIWVTWVKWMTWKTGETGGHDKLEKWEIWITWVTYGTWETGENCGTCKTCGALTNCPQQWLMNFLECTPHNFNMNFWKLLLSDWLTEWWT